MKKIIVWLVLFFISINNVIAYSPLITWDNSTFWSNTWFWTLWDYSNITWWKLTSWNKEEMFTDTVINNWNLVEFSKTYEVTITIDSFDPWFNGMCRICLGWTCWNQIVWTWLYSEEITSLAEIDWWDTVFYLECIRVNWTFDNITLKQKEDSVIPWNEISFLNTLDSITLSWISNSWLLLNWTIWDVWFLLLAVIILGLVILYFRKIIKILKELWKK